MYMLLHCDGVMTRPSGSSTLPKGLPVATIARPSLHMYASSGEISALEVGLESGITIGRSVCFAIARIAPSLIVPRLPLSPSTRSGFTCSMTASRADPSAMSERAKNICSSVRLEYLDLPSSPHWSKTKKFSAAIFEFIPSCTIAECSACATPMPADPAPTTATRKLTSSAAGRRCMRSAPSTPARTTAPVPCMSSLKQR
mmetsp:Transcript_21904/g.50369  ORF Transcript_21904/g.50369 Transcript_21904/m.50369 type:complete len:200 (-) Transcript_21904:894-1493(-)